MENGSEFPQHPEVKEESLVKKFLRFNAIYEEAPDEPAFHAPISLVGFEGIERAEVTLNAIRKGFQDYALSPVIKDGFGSDHHERTKWEETLPADLRKESGRNKLRLNRITAVNSGFNVLLSFLEGHNIESPEAEEFYALQNGLDEKIYEYAHLETTERLKIAREMDEICRKFIRMITRTEKAP